MIYSFDTVIASDYGVDEAIMLQNLCFWIAKNKAEGRNFHDGKTWTYNTVSEFHELFKFWTEKQVRRILKSLIDQGLIVTGNYNKHGYDRTLWYALYDESLCGIDKIHLSKREQALDETGGPIPDSKPDSLPDSNSDIRKANASSKNYFIKPTIEEVEEYCKSRGNKVDSNKWMAHYESVGWMVGKNKMRDWRAAVRTWEPDGFKPSKPVSKCKKCGGTLATIGEYIGTCFDDECDMYHLSQ